MNRLALRLFVTPPPAKLHFATQDDPRARAALVAFLVRRLARGERE